MPAGLSPAVAQSVKEKMMSSSPLEKLLNSVKEVSDVGVLKALYERAMKEYANDAAAAFAIQEAVLWQKERLAHPVVQLAPGAPAVERFVDDGRFFIEWNLNCPRDRGNGVLFARCNSDLGAPIGVMVAGGYEQQPDGKWQADVMTFYDEERDSDCRVLGAFETRNEAIAVLWKERENAELAREVVADGPVACAWDAAMQAADGKGAIVFGSMSEGREFNGKVLHADAVYVVQNMGRGVAVHVAGALSRSVAVGEVLTVKYDAQGRGVIPMRQVALERE